MRGNSNRIVLMTRARIVLSARALCHPTDVRHAHPYDNPNVYIHTCIPQG